MNEALGEYENSTSGHAVIITRSVRLLTRAVHAMTAAGARPAGARRPAGR